MDIAQQLRDLSPVYWFIAFAILSIFLIAIYLVSKLVLHSRKVHLRQPTQTIKRLSFPSVAVEQTKNILLKKNHIDTLINNQVKKIYFIHGTFLGTDPLELAPFLKKILPNFLQEELLNKLQHLFKNQSNKLLKDSANFTPKHLELIDESSEKKITAHNFLWSSGNHHIARVRGALDLFESLYKDCQDLNKNDEIMLIAHSHGGQLLALVSQLIFDSSWANELFKLIDPKNAAKNYADFLPKRYELLEFNFKFVTLGSPYRYDFNEQCTQNLLHIINHRRDVFSPFSLKGILYTLDGDYPHKWGTQGSDFLAPAAIDRKINRRLDQFLDLGIDLKNLKTNIEQQEYIPKKGSTVLVDYHDENIENLTPNCLATVFGHGIYTCLEAFDYLFELITDEFYSSGSEAKNE